MRPSELVVDGGNILWVGRRVVLTDRVYSDNADLSPLEVRRRLLEVLQAEQLEQEPLQTQLFAHRWLQQPLL